MSQTPKSSPPRRTILRSTTSSSPPSSSYKARPVAEAYASKVQLIKENFQFNDRVMEKLPSECRDFVVVGCIGAEGVGKSSILSQLAQTPVFPKQTIDAIAHARRQTTAVEMYLTKDNVVYLDTPAIYTSMVLGDTRTADMNSRFVMPSHDNEKVQALQLSVFLFAVCDVVLVVDDRYGDSALAQFLRQVEMLLCHFRDPHGLNAAENCAKAVFVTNKVQESQQSALQIQTHEQMLQCYFQHSLFIHKSHEDSLEKVEIPWFLLPDTLDLEDEDTIDKDSVAKLRQFIRSHPAKLDDMKSTLMPKTKSLQLREWIRHIEKVYENICSSAVMTEYMQTLQRLQNPSH